MSDEGGCGHQYPGIGDIAFVKDLMSKKITTRSFDCSRFGASIAPGLGWVCILIFVYLHLYQYIKVKEECSNAMSLGAGVNIAMHVFIC